MKQDKPAKQDKENKEIIRESNDLVFATTGFTGIQMNMFFRALTRFDLKPEDIEEERRYLVEFQRNEIPRVDKTKKLEAELDGLQEITIKSNTEGGWNKLKPFPKVGEYSNGTIQIWFDGEYLKPILELKEEKGYAVFLIVEMFSLQGKHAKKLFEIFSSYKNRNNTRFEYEISALKQILGIPDKYKDNPGMFMKKVVYPSVEQVNEKTRLMVNAAYRRKRGKHPAMVVFDVHKQEKIETGQEKSKQIPPKSEGEKKREGYLDDRQNRCYEIMVERYGFAPQQAFNCASRDETTRLFFRWQNENGISADLNKTLSKKDARLMFFKELKAHGYKI
jgi:hypothetical protein